MRGSLALGPPPTAQASETLRSRRARTVGWAFVFTRSAAGLASMRGCGIISARRVSCHTRTRVACVPHSRGSSAPGA